ncbi:RHS repeat-associated core domain-containing protein [Pseudomonas sp. Ap32]|nr:RHS repeat-associated core domain-containing protein [Pseudomonas sp. Ap32]
MQQNLKQHLFYNIDQLSTAVGINQSITLFSATGTPLAERAAETLLTAVNAQNSITNSLHRDRIQCLTYSAYGHSHIDHVLGYTGQRCDRFTNLYLLGNGYRAYSPYLMRFYSPDNLSPFGKGGEMHMPIARATQRTIWTHPARC